MTGYKTKIGDWKKEGLNPMQVEFADGKVAFFQTPNRKKLRLIFSKAGQGGPIAMTEAFVKNCYLDGTALLADILDDNDTSKIAELAATIDELLNTKKAAVKKL